MGRLLNLRISIFYFARLPLVSFSGNKEFVQKSIAKLLTSFDVKLGLPILDHINETYGWILIMLKIREKPAVGVSHYLCG